MVLRCSSNSIFTWFNVSVGRRMGTHTEIFPPATVNSGMTQTISDMIALWHAREIQFACGVDKKWVIMVYRANIYQKFNILGTINWALMVHSTLKSGRSTFNALILPSGPLSLILMFQVWVEFNVRPYCWWFDLFLKWRLHVGNLLNVADIAQACVAACLWGGLLTS